MREYGRKYSVAKWRGTFRKVIWELNKINFCAGLVWCVMISAEY